MGFNLGFKGLTDLENMAKMMACLLPTTLRSCGKQMSATVHHWQ